MFLFSLSREAMEKFWEGKRIKHQGKEGSSSSSGERIKEKVEFEGISSRCKEIRSGLEETRMKMIDIVGREVSFLELLEILLFWINRAKCVQCSGVLVLETFKEETATGIKEEVKDLPLDQGDCDDDYEEEEEEEFDDHENSYNVLEPLLKVELDSGSPRKKRRKRGRPRKNEVRQDQQHSAITVECKGCGKDFGRALVSFSDHLMNNKDCLEHHRQEWWICQFCGLGSWDSIPVSCKGKTSSPQFHEEMHFAKNCTQPKSADDSTECDRCKTQHENLEALRSHALSVHGMTSLVCLLCHSISDNSEGLRRHVSKIHFDAPFQCCKCLKQRTFSEDHKCGRELCSVCGKAILLRSMKDHLKTHGEKEELCGFCGMTFSDKRSCRRHERLHTGDRRHKCPHCDFSAIQKWGLKSHLIRKHAELKPFTCEECGHGFSCKEELDIHANTHKGTKEYQCHMCQKLFQTKLSLRYHERNQHEIRKQKIKHDRTKRKEKKPLLGS